MSEENLISFQAVPCGNFCEEEHRCVINRKVPQDCGGCTSYLEGVDYKERVRCERWSRVMGYHRPIDAWNKGKQAEHKDRVLFKEAAVQAF